ncbi:hypothetical protein, partial [Cupriavidus sp. SK-3]|uniref:hypothetical protein n=1 Tax=Cupriavidus sp. SK-3 TaxID=1470558 RepID=UPI001F1B7974
NGANARCAAAQIWRAHTNTTTPGVRQCATRSRLDPSIVPQASLAGVDAMHEGFAIGMSAD